ncbi:MAG: UDP-N-acetylglucosamine 1-carboxyvinyltransferase [Christensenellales bacterium]|jgi:UDP-N-acetylglucosamine 1-carboxyvinyltransferase
MDNLIIKGGRPLNGSIAVSGAKNAAVAILPAVLLTDDVCTIDNLPYIKDVLVLKDILVAMGADVNLTTDGRMSVDPSGTNTHKADYELAQTMRASYYLLGVLLGRFGKAEVALPGGCVIGSRPIDQHIKGLTAMGATLKIEHGIVFAEAEKLKGTDIYLDVVSVGATINLMLAAVLAEGTTTIVNAAKEPHVVDLASCLNSMGAKVSGAGTDIIRVRGVAKLGGCNYTIIPDQIETGTLMLAAAATRGDVTVTNVIPTHMDALTAKLIEAGIKVSEGENWIRILTNGRPNGVNIKTLPYPGFPTDLQQPFTSLLSTAEGTSMIIESIFEDRFKHVYELRRMGADIQVDNRVAVISGVERLTGAPVRASDLRAGAALIIAGLMAEGTTVVSNMKYVDRGYHNFENKLISLGADMERAR